LIQLRPSGLLGSESSPAKHTMCTSMSKLKCSKICYTVVLTSVVTKALVVETETKA